MTNYDLNANANTMVPSKFIGKGIVCGLEVCTDENCLIVINGGYGFSESGGLLEVSPGPKKFGYYCPYDLKMPYPLFQAGVNPPQNYPLWELLENPVEGTKPLTPQTEEELENLFLEDKVALLFWEGEGTSGEQKYLLMRRSDLMESLGIADEVDQILGDKAFDDDFVYSEDYSLEDNTPNADDIYQAENKVFDLKRVSIPRFGFAKEDPYDCPPDSDNDCELSKLDALEDLYNAYVRIIDQVSGDLDNELQKLYKDYAPLLLHPPLSEAENCLDQLCEKWIAFKLLNISEKTEEHRKEFVQYFYDWMRDLVKAYHELRVELADLQCYCPIQTTGQGRHLLLGLVMRSNKLYQTSPLRSTFQQAPVFNGNADRLQKVRLYFRRILMMVKSFHFPGFSFDSENGVYCRPEEEEVEDIPSIDKIKITPSVCCSALLEKQTIPFYYPLSYGRYSVHRYWNYRFSVMGSVDRNRSYYASSSEDSYTQIPEVIHPLCYDLCAYDCFRIEGHVGKRVEDVLSIFKEDQVFEIKGLDKQFDFFIKKYNLDFKVKIISGALTAVNKPVGPDGNIIYWWQYLNQLVGMEHSGMVKRGGTFIIVVEKGKVIGDFSLPYLCCDDDFVRIKNNSIGAVEVEVPTVTPVELPGQTLELPEAAGEIMERVVAYLGEGLAEEKDDLKLIKGIGPAIETKLNAVGIFNYTQLSKLEEHSYALLDEVIGGVRGRALRDDYKGEALKLLDNA